jgi:hypothetical protein
MGWWCDDEHGGILCGTGYEWRERRGCNVLRL